MNVQPLICRWGIIGSGPSAVRFIQDVKAAAAQGKGSSLPIQHRLTVITISAPQTSAKEFIEQYFPSIASSSDPSPAHAASVAALLAAPDVDAVLVDSTEAEQYHDAELALRAGKAVLLVKPLGISAEDARRLTQVAKSKKTWLGILMKETKKDKASLRWVADECARCRERSLSESAQTGWEDNISILELLDEMRASGMIRKKTETPACSPAQPARQSRADPAAPALYEETAEVGTPQKKTASTNDEIDLAPRKYPRSPHPGPSGLSNILESPTPSSIRPAPNGITQAIPPANGATTDSSINSKNVNTSSADAVSSDQAPPVVSSEAQELTSLRAQVQELKHLLRQKNAHVAALETGNTQQNGDSTLAAGGSKTRASVRVSMPPRAYSDKPYTGGLPPPTRPVRTRTTSVTSIPSAPASSQSTASSAEIPVSRRRKDVNIEVAVPTENIRPSSRASSTAGTDVSTGPSSARFLAPTVASERRRLASLNDQVNVIARRAVSGDAAAPSNSESDKANTHANKLILQLNNELQHVRSQLESNKTQFSISQRNLSTLQKSYDSTKEALHKARVEVERHATALARKERQTLEAQERARKAEDDAKELGRSSRELGTRVRMVESELGDVRRAQAQAVAGYEAITSAWKKTRTHWEEEVKGLRGQLQEVVKEHRAQAQSALDKFEAAEVEWKGREGEKKGLEAVLEGLRAEREKARVQVAGVVDGLVSRLAAHEEEREGQDRKVEEVRGELQRLLRFMREGVTDPDQIRKGVLVQ